MLKRSWKMSDRRSADMASAHCRSRFCKPSVVRFTDWVAKFSLLPTNESLGYFQSFANADWQQ
jgi:hypothetical protein